MEINDYQTQIRDYIDYPLELGPYSIILSLQNNVGVLSDKLNVALKNDHGALTKEARMKCAISIGDILFDLTNITSELGYTMDDILSINLTKHRMGKEKEINEDKTNKNS